MGLNLAAITRPLSTVLAFVSPPPPARKRRKGRATPAKARARVAISIDKSTTSTSTPLGDFRARGLALHPAPAGADVPRYAPHGFPFPVWSVSDLDRPNATKFSKVTGRPLLKDRRTPWKKGKFHCFSIGKDGYTVKAKGMRDA